MFTDPNEEEKILTAIRAGPGGEEGFNKVMHGLRPMLKEIEEKDVHRVHLRVWNRAATRIQAVFKGSQVRKVRSSFF
jgi:hypothetical protein